MPKPIPIAWPNELALPPLRPFAFTPTPVGKSPFDALEARSIPAEERFAWQPRDLVAVVGSHARRHWGPGNSAVISPDGRWAATTAHSAFEPALLWDLATQKSRPLDGGGTGLVGFTADRRCCFLILGDEVIAYDTSTWQRNSLGKLTDEGDRSPSRMDRVGFCEGGWTLVLAHWDQEQLVLFDLRGQKPRLADRWPMMRPDGVSVPALVAVDGNRVVYRGKSGGYQRISIRNGRFEEDLALEIGRDPDARTFGLSPKGDRLVVWHEGRAKVWNVSGTAPVQVGALPPESLTPNSSLALSADGRWLAAKSTATRLYRMDGPQPEAVAWLDQTDTGWGGEVAFSKAGDRAVLVNSEGFVRFWDLAKAAPIELSPFDPASAFPAPEDLVSSPIDGASGRLIAPRYDGPNGQAWARYAFWSLAGKRPEAATAPLTLDGPGKVFPMGPDRCVAVQWSPPFVRYFHRQDRGWAPEEGAGLPASGPWGLLAPGSRNLLNATLDGDRDFSLWDLEAAPPHRRWAIALADRAPPSPYASKVAFSADLRIMATAFPPRGQSGSELILWKDILTEHPTPAARISLPIDAGAMGGYHLALSPDGRFLVHNPAANHEMIVLDLTGTKPREVHRLGSAEHTAGLRSLAFSPDARRLAWAGETEEGVIDLVAGAVPLPRLSPGGANWLAFAPDGRHLFLHNRNKTFSVYRFKDWGKAPISPDTKGARTKRP
ncbi:MAG: WD40 repeat domain-containing protein [Isosphaeraceae bacterium]